MGLDVFGVFQKRENERWVSIQKYYYGQRDELRIWLGAPLGGHRDLPSIASPRGLPADFDAGEWVGDHFKSWLLVDEILNALPALAISTEKICVKAYFDACEREPILIEWEASIDEAFAKEYFDRHKKDFNRKESEHQDRCLIRLVAASPKPFDATFTNEYGFIECIYDYSDYFQEFISEARLLKNKYADVRFVFGFS